MLKTFRNKTDFLFNVSSTHLQPIILSNFAPVYELSSIFKKTSTLCLIQTQGWRKQNKKLWRQALLLPFRKTCFLLCSYISDGSTLVAFLVLTCLLLGFFWFFFWGGGGT